MIENLTKLILDWQAEKGLSDSQLADLLGISQSLVSYLRSGQRKLGIDTVRKIYTNIPELRNECFQWVLPEMAWRTRKELSEIKGWQ